MRKTRHSPEPQKVFGACWIALTKGAFTLVDESDYESLMSKSWMLTSEGYAARNVSKKRRQRIYMHHQILGLKRVDHRNGNPLDNRRLNLRPASQQQNMMNKAAQPVRRSHKDLSNIKGVFRTKNGRFKVQIGIDRSTHHVGVFDRLGEAILVYNTAARSLFGSFARLNSEDPELIARLEAQVPLPPPRLRTEWRDKNERVAERIRALEKLASGRL